MRRILTLALAAAAVATASPAMAAAIINGDGSVTFNGNAGSNTVNLAYNGLAGNPKAVTPGLSGLMALTLSSVSGNVYNFSYTLQNTSTVAGTRISGFGFNVDPLAYLTGVTAGSGDIFDLTTLSANFASIGADVCLNGGPGNCPESNPANSLGFGATTSGSFALTFNPTQNSITLSNFLDRYQGFSTTNVNQQTVTSAIGVGTSSAVPEPATWAMMLLGFGGIGMAMRRGRKEGRLLQVA